MCGGVSVCVCEGVRACEGVELWAVCSRWTTPWTDRLVMGGWVEIESNSVER